MNRWSPLLLAAGVLAWEGRPAQVAPPSVAVPSWRGVTIATAPLTEAQVAGRERLQPPGVVPRAGLASPSRVPWVHSNAARFRRSPAGKYAVEPAEGRALVAVGEAAMYDADMLIGIAASDSTRVAALIDFLGSVPPLSLPEVADFGFVDDGTPLATEAMALFARRNLLFARVDARDRTRPLTVKLGTKEWPANLAIDPGRLAQAVRRKITDAERSLRVYGSEVVIARLTGDATRRRLQLLAYGGRQIDGLRLRLRGTWRTVEARVFGSPATPLTPVDELVVEDGWTEFSLPTLAPYAVVDLR